MSKRRRKNKAKSRAQQRLFGLALAVKRRQKAAARVSAAVRRLAKLQVRVIRKFAKTAHRRLPLRVKRSRRPAPRRYASGRRRAARGRRSARRHGKGKYRSVNPLTRSEVAKLIKAARTWIKVAKHKGMTQSVKREAYGRASGLVAAIDAVGSRKGIWSHSWPKLTRGQLALARQLGLAEWASRTNPYKCKNRKNPILQIAGKRKRNSLAAFIAGAALGYGFGSPTISGVGAKLTTAGAGRLAKHIEGEKENPKPRRNPLSRAESGRLIWWSRWLRTAVREMRKHGVIEPEAAAFRRGEASEAARIARFYGKAGSRRAGVKKTRRAIRAGMRRAMEKNPWAIVAAKAYGKGKYRVKAGARVQPFTFKSERAARAFVRRLSHGPLARTAPWTVRRVNHGTPRCSNPLTRKETAYLLRRGRAFIRAARKETGTARIATAGRAFEDFEIARDLGKAGRHRGKSWLAGGHSALRLMYNPILQIVGPSLASGMATGMGFGLGAALTRRNAGKRNPSTPGQRIVSKHEITLAKARKAPGFAAAMKGYKRFHASAPARATVIRIADGSKAVTRRAVFVIGQAPEVTYQTVKGQASNKAGKNGKKVVWQHRMGEGGGKRPLLVHDPKSGVTSLLGGTYRVTDWFRA